MTDKHDIKILKEFYDELKSFENIDFQEELKRTELKIRVLKDVTQKVENDGKIKNNIEDLEAL